MGVAINYIISSGNESCSIPNNRNNFLGQSSSIISKIRAQSYGCSTYIPWSNAKIINISTGIIANSGNSYRVRSNVGCTSNRQGIIHVFYKRITIQGYRIILKLDFRTGILIGINTANACRLNACRKNGISSCIQIGYSIVIAGFCNVNLNRIGSCFRRIGYQIPICIVNLGCNSPNRSGSAILHVYNVRLTGIIRRCGSNN